MGGQSGSRHAKPQGAEPSCRGSFDLARRFSSVGARILPCRAARAPGCRSPMSSCRTVGPFLCGRIGCRPMRCGSMLIGTASAFWAASLSVASTTVRLGRHRSEAWPNEDGGGSDWPRQRSAGQRPVSCHDESSWLRAGVLQSGFGLGQAIGSSQMAAGKSRRTFRIPGIACGNQRRTFPILRR